MALRWDIGRRTLALAGLLALAATFALTGGKPDPLPLPLAVVTPPAPPAAPIKAKRGARLKKSAKKEAPPKKKAERGARLREKGEAMGGGKRD